MSPRNKVLVSLYLDPEQKKQLDALAKKSGFSKTDLLSDAVDDLLARNGMGAESKRVTLVRKALKVARAELEKYGRDIEQRKAGVIPYRSCIEAIHQIDLAREEVGE